MTNNKESNELFKSIESVAKQAVDAKPGVQWEAADWLRTLMRKLDDAIAQEQSA